MPRPKINFITLLVILLPVLGMGLIIGVVGRQIEKPIERSAGNLASSAPLVQAPLGQEPELVKEGEANPALGENALVYQGQEIPLTWADDNTNENLILRTDRKYYDGNGMTELYLSVTNSTESDHNTDIVFWFDSEQKRIEQVEKITDSQNPKSQILNSKQIQNSQIQISNRKSINNYIIGSSFTDTIIAHETNFYKLALSYPKNQSQSEFFIEAFGSADKQLEINNQKSEIAYGHLDPYLSGGLVGYWSFNGNDINWASQTAYDRSGLGNNGTITNMSTTSSPAIGISGQALKFDGADDLINIGSDTSLDDIFDGGGTMSAWIYPRSLGEGGAGTIFYRYRTKILNYQQSGSYIRLYLEKCFDSCVNYGGWRNTNYDIPLNT